MCGIVAEHGGSDPAELERMLERLAHRGPDDRGSVAGRRQPGSATGGCRSSTSRAAAAARAPPTASVCLVGNGEVYNHEEVRAAARRAASRSRPPTTRSRCTCSTSTGPEALARLNGMFAFVMAGRRRALRRRPRPGRDQAAVLGAARRRASRFASRDARLRRPSGRPLRRAVPARLRVDAGGRAGALRLRRARTAARAAGAAEDRCCAGTRDALIARGRAPDDGRRARRRVPLRRPGLEPRRRDRRPRVARARRAAAHVRGRHRRLARPRRRARRSPSTSAPSTTRSIYTRGGGARVAARRRARDRVLRPGARAQRGAELPARAHDPPARARSCSPARAPTSCSPATTTCASSPTPTTCTPSSSARSARCTTSTSSAATA